ncbi:MAG: hypothetical protein LLG20_09865 [Acidobacteriales bacterium]|nr:hypothetical protein [Terriglobales bacterium]
MRRAFLFQLLFGATIVAAQAPLDRPRIGYLADRGGALRPLYGTAANFILGEPLSDGVVSCASSNTSALVKTRDEVILIVANGEAINRWAAPGESALFAFYAGGAPALVYIPESLQLARMVEDRLETVPVDPERLGGEVAAIAARDRFHALVAVARGDQIWLAGISTENGEVTGERLLAGVTGRVHLLEDESVLFQENADLVWRANDGNEKRFPLAGEIRSFAPLGAGWVAISVQHDRASGPTRYGLRLDAGREGIYQLPEAAQ